MMERLVDAALSHPAVLLQVLDTRIQSLSGISTQGDDRLGQATAFFEDELDLLRERRELLARRLQEEPRVARLAEWLRGGMKRRKAIVFVDSSPVADRVHGELCALLGMRAVLRHDHSDAATAFHRDPEARVLVCDAGSEEGLNLQRIGAAVVHYDLPLAPNRLEQRIGRADRIAAHGRLTNVVFSASAPYEHEWLACLTDVVRIFDRATAPLQYVLNDAMAQVRRRLLDEGPSAITAVARSMSDTTRGLDAELRRIKQQEAIDALEVDVEAERSFFSELESADEDLEQTGRRSFEDYFVKTLGFGYRSEGEDVVRYGYFLERPPLLPFGEALQQFGACIDPGATDRGKKELPFKPCTFSRSVAEEAAVGLVRIGHPILDAVETLVRHDDRGCAFAMWRVLRNWRGDAALFLQFDFLVEADLRAASALVDAASGSPAAVRRRAEEAFPGRPIRLLLDAGLSAITDPELIAVLEQPYCSVERGGSDLNIRHERWAAVDTEAPVADWGDLCVRARRAAEAALRGSRELTKACTGAAARLRSAGHEAQQRMQSRIARIQGAAAASEAVVARFEAELTEALARGIEAPSVRLDAVGAIYVSKSLPARLRSS